jgi:hypothetical protein
MSEPFDQPADPAQFGPWLAQKTRAEQQASAKAMNDMFSGGGQDAHRATSAQLRAGQHGIFGAADSPQEQAAAVAGRQAIVGSDYGGRPLEKLGGMFSHSEVGCAPAPARVDLRYVNSPGGQQPTGESAWEAWKRGR